MAYKCKNDIKVARKLLTAIHARMYWVINDMCGLCERGKDKESQGPKFTHPNNYKYIYEDCMVLCDLLALMYNFTTDDNSCYSRSMTEKTFKRKLQKLCDFCGIKDEDID